MQIVTLNEDLYQPFRDCRLAALRDAPEAFASSYDREALLTAEQWKARPGSGPTARLQRPC